MMRKIVLGVLFVLSTPLFAQHSGNPSPAKGQHSIIQTKEINTTNRAKTAKCTLKKYTAELVGLGFKRTNKRSDIPLDRGSRLKIRGSSYPVNYVRSWQECMALALDKAKDLEEVVISAVEFGYYYTTNWGPIAQRIYYPHIKWTFNDAGWGDSTGVVNSRTAEAAGLTTEVSKPGSYIANKMTQGNQVYNGTKPVKKISKTERYD